MFVIVITRRQWRCADWAGLCADWGKASQRFRVRGHLERSVLVHLGSSGRSR